MKQADTAVYEQKCTYDHTISFQSDIDDHALADYQSCLDAPAYNSSELQTEAMTQEHVYKVLANVEKANCYSANDASALGINTAKATKFSSEVFSGIKEKYHECNAVQSVVVASDIQSKYSAESIMQNHADAIYSSIIVMTIALIFTLKSFSKSANKQQKRIYRKIGV